MCLPAPSFNGLSSLVIPPGGMDPVCEDSFEVCTPSYQLLHGSFNEVKHLGASMHLAAPSQAELEKLVS